MKRGMLKAGIIILTVCCFIAFPFYKVFAYEQQFIVRVDYTDSKYGLWIDSDYSYYPTNFNLNLNMSSFTAMMTDNASYLTNDSVDSAYPGFILVSTQNVTDVGLLPTNSRCFNVDDLNSFAVSSNASTNQYIDVFNLLVGSGTAGSNNFSIVSVDLRLLIGLGYRLSAKSNYISGGNSYYVYMLNKFKATEIDFSNQVGTGSGTVTLQTSHTNLYYLFWRMDFNTFSMTKRDDNSQVRMSDGDMIIINDTFDFTGWNLYEYNDIQLRAYDWSSANIVITGMSPYIVLVKTSETTSAANYTSHSGSFVYGPYFPKDQIDLNVGEIDIDLTETNLILTEIRDLLSDLQVDEITNITNEIVNNYDVDIDLTVSDLIGDLSTNLQGFDFEDPLFDPEQVDIQKAADLRVIFTGMFQTMNDSGLAIFYFLPLVLIVIGLIM